VSPTRPTEAATPTNYPSTLTIEPPTIEPPIIEYSTLTPTQFPPPEETIELPSIPTRSPEIWKSEITDKKKLEEIAISQFDLAQYKNLDPQNKLEFANAHYLENSCGPTIIAILMNLYDVREPQRVTISDVINGLVKDKLIKSNGTNMTDRSLRRAIESIGQEYYIFSVVPLTPVSDPENPIAIPGSEWSELFKAAQETVLNKGGVLVAFVQEAGNPSVGHFILIPSFDNGETVIMDPKNGSVRTIGLGAYTPSLLSLFGVVPSQQ